MLISTHSQTIIRYLVGTYTKSNSIFGPLWRAVPMNATTQQVLGLERSEQRAYLENLWHFNHESQPAATANDTDLYGSSHGIGVRRPFNQLPCTVASRKARADLLAHEDPASCRILVLGDDDLLSVELAQRGFSHVTVADCDEQLLARIRAETSALANPPDIIAADFQAGLGWDGRADVVFLDPPYSVAGAAAFLQLAISSAAPKARIYLMINPYVIGRDFSRIIAQAVHAGFYLKQQRPAFNSYPIGWYGATILRLGWHYLLGAHSDKPTPRQLYFCSDCFEFGRD